MTLRLSLAILLAFVTGNFLAFYHTGAMTRFSESGQKTRMAEDLGWLERIEVLISGINIPKPQNNITPADYGLHFEVHNYQSSSGYDLEAWYVPADSPAKVVLLFHGYAASKEGLLPLVPFLRSLGHNSMLVDFFGSGGSSGNHTTLGYLEANDVISSIHYVKSKWPDAEILLYGISMGGAAITRAFTIEELPVNAVVLESPYDNLLVTTKNRFNSMSLPGFPFAEMLVAWGSIRLGFNGFALNPAEFAKHITVPTLVLHGAQDPRVTSTDAKAIYRNLAGAKRFHSFHGAGHQTFARVVPEAWQAEVMEFLDD